MEQKSFSEDQANRPKIQDVMENPLILNEFAHPQLLRRVLEGENHAFTADYNFGRKVKPFEVGVEIIDGSNIRVLFTCGNGVKVRDSKSGEERLEGDIRYVGYVKDPGMLPADLFCEGK